MNKTCIHCKEEKELTMFTKDKRSSDGHVSTCKECRYAKEKEYNERRKKDAKYKAYQSAYHEANKEYRGKRNNFKSFIQSFRRQHILPQRIYIRKCPVTGALFTTRYNSKKYSEEGAKMVESFQSNISYVRKHYEGEGQKDCVQCGKSFIPIYGSKDRCCSSECKKANRKKHKGDSRCNHRQRARMYGVKYEPINPLAVFERDNWTCQLTGVKTPKRLRGTFHDNAPELDHIIPLSQGGSHTYDNVQCASRKANLEKGNKIIGQLRVAI